MSAAATGAWAGAVAGLLSGPLLAVLVRTAPAPGPWWAPWRAGGAAGPVAGRDRVLITVLAVAGGALAGAGGRWGPAWAGFVLVGVVAAPLTVVDLRLHRLPDRLVLPAGLLAVALLGGAALAPTPPAGGAWVRALACAAGAGLVLFLLALTGGMGLGDAKFGALLALLLGWRSVGAVVLGLGAGFVVGAVVAAALLAGRRATLRSAVPFGPSLALGALGVVALLGR